MSRSYIYQSLRGVVEPLLLFIIGELLPIHGYEIARELDRHCAVWRVEDLWQVRGSKFPGKGADVMR